MICLDSTTLVWLNVIILLGKIYPKNVGKTTVLESQRGPRPDAVHLSRNVAQHKEADGIKALLKLRITIYSIENTSSKTTDSLYSCMDIDYSQHKRWKIFVKRQGEFQSAWYLVF